MKYLVILLAFASALLLQGCGKFNALYEECIVADRVVDVSLVENGNHMHEYEWRYVPGFGNCGGAHVNGSYNVGTQEAQEKIERGNLTFTSSFQCDTDPWIHFPNTSCTRNVMLFRQTGGDGRPDLSEFSSEDIHAFENAPVPLSAWGITAMERGSLKEKLADALQKLPSVIVRPAADITVPDSVGVVTKPVSDSVRITAPEPLPILQKGADGEVVMALQYLLRQGGAKDIVIDGDFGNQTESAVRDFQRRNNIAQDGKVGPQTWARLWVTIKRGAPQKDAVSAAQVLLKWHGKTVVIDGDFGNQTDGAVRSFQKDEKLAEDGIVGPDTWKALVIK